ncbi:MAG TPA: glycosyltransferase [Candidatus Deferrimicrobiaceae bacterium]
MTERIAISEQLLAASRPQPWSGPLDLALCSAILLGLGGLLWLGIYGHAYDPWVRVVETRHWVRVIERPSLLWFLMGLLMLTFRTLLWFRYRPFPAAVPDEAPSLTVIIPAYNEGAMVEQTIDSVVAANYPKDRLEIFVVDDGSTDDTWACIQRAAQRHPDLVTPVRFPRNQGKRAALAEGFRRGRGDVFLTIDSDSVIDAGTLLAMAGPFRDPKVGAVAGKVLVYNLGGGIIPRMLRVRYVLSFDFLRSVQSTYRTVYCCPGALAAYRADAVRNALARWLEQTFLGAPCTYGEDRALTNYILEDGYDTVYQRTGIVRTIVPETYGKLCCMYIRWERSNIKEEIRFARVVWRRPAGPRIIAIVDKIITNLRYPVAYATLALLVVWSIDDPQTILRLFLAIGGISLLNMLYYLRSERSWDFLYGVIYSYYFFLTMFWIFPYAAATLRSRSWLTR